MVVTTPLEKIDITSSLRRMTFIGHSPMTSDIYIELMGGPAAKAEGILIGRFSVPAAVLGEFLLQGIDALEAPE